MTTDEIARASEKFRHNLDLCGPPTAEQVARWDEIARTMQEYLQVQLRYAEKMRVVRKLFWDGLEKAMNAEPNPEEPQP